MRSNGCTWTTAQIRHKLYRTIKPLAADGNQRSLPVRASLTQHEHQRVCAQIANLLTSIPQETELVQVLNSISKFTKLPDLLTHFPIGDALRTLHELSGVLEQLQWHYSDDDIKTKETLLAAITILSPDHSITNKSIVGPLFTRSFRNGERVTALKSEFNAQKSRTLCHSAKRKGHGYPLILHQNALEYYTKITHPNPNRKKARILKDANGEKYSHPRHDCFYDYRVLYEM